MNCVTGVEFYGPPPPNDRNRVRISGSNLKYPTQAADVESQSFDASGHGTAVRPAVKILNPSGTQCEAQLAHYAADYQVKVRMRCSDGSWSTWLTAKKD